ncbi:alpha/beta hydrolase [Nocardia sp. IBHARD005]|uniref:alpha/beta hydrolase n=1 Tax=Nocardia sp. IBHARD005 TaxID=3457765 RepID=UPI004059BF09
MQAAALGGADVPRTHLFGHSYGSTTTSHAGQYGRLSGDVSTITLLGSPGAGPLHHATDFGIGKDNVFVATSSKDPVTFVGANTDGGVGRFLPGGRLGQGMDPSIAAFGATRVAAEFSADASTLRGNINTHTAYYTYQEAPFPGADAARLPGEGPSESLQNFARIAAGLQDTVLPEFARPGHQEPNSWQGKVASLPNDPARGREPVSNMRDGGIPEGYHDLVAEHRVQLAEPPLTHRHTATSRTAHPKP